MRATEPRRPSAGGPARRATGEPARPSSAASPETGPAARIAGLGPVPLALAFVLVALAATAFHVSSRLRNDLEAELAGRLRIAADLVTETLARRDAEDVDGPGDGAGPVLDARLATRLEEVRRRTSVSEIALYDRDGGFLGGSVSGPLPGAIPGRLRIREPAAGAPRTAAAARAPERDGAGGLTLVVPLAPDTGLGALLTRIDRTGQASLASVDLLFGLARALAAVLVAAGMLVLVRWVGRGATEPAARSPRPTPSAPVSDVDMVLGTMKEVMSTLKDSESESRDRATAAEADAARWRRTNDLILESISSGIVAFDGDGRITLFNRAAEEIFGFGSRHALGRPLATVFGAEDRVTRLGDELLRTRRAVSRVEWERPGPDGESRWIGLASSPIRDPGGREGGGILLVGDLTETKRLRDAMALKDRLSAVGEMSAGVAHEIRNCLHSMRGYENLLHDDLSGQEPSMAVQGILAEAAALESLVQGILEFSRPSVLACSATNVDALLDEIAASMAEAARNANVEIRRERPAAPVRAEVDAGRLRAVFLNLARNAVEAMDEDGGTLTIASRLVDLPGERDSAEVSPGEGEAGGGDAVGLGGGRGGPHVRVSFRDTGPGIPDVDRARIFTPFWTTKRDGTGLGLALAHKTVTDHGGRIQLHSRAGVGTEFVLLLPAEAS